MHSSSSASKKSSKVRTSKALQQQQQQQQRRPLPPPPPPSSSTSQPSLLRLQSIATDSLLVRAVQSAAQALEHGLDRLIEFREATSTATTLPATSSSRHSQRRQRPLDSHQLHLVERILLRGLVTSSEQLLLQTIVHGQRVYVQILQFYLKVLSTRLEQERERFDDELLESLRSSSSSSPLPPIATTTTTTTVAARTLNMEYLNAVFSDSPQIMQLIDCLSSIEKFDQSLVEYPEPMLRECGGLFKRLCKSYTVKCLFDDRLLSVMMQFQKEELYVIVADKFHQNVPTVKFLLMILHKALEYQQEPKIIVGKLSTVWNDVYGLVINMIYQWLLSVDSRDVQTMFSGMLRKFQAFNEQLPTLVKQLREDLFLVNAAHESPSTIALMKNYNRTTTNDNNDDDEGDENDSKMSRGASVVTASQAVIQTSSSVKPVKRLGKPPRTLL